VAKAKAKTGARTTCFALSYGNVYHLKTTRI